VHKGIQKVVAHRKGGHCTSRNWSLHESRVKTQVTPVEGHCITATTTTNLGTTSCGPNKVDV